MCLNSTRLCDGVDDCPDATDETNCTVSCNEEEFLCDRQCLNMSRVCDGRVDCTNHEDENGTVCLGMGQGLKHACSSSSICTHILFVIAYKLRLSNEQK